jgi:hypothetical protein
MPYFQMIWISVLFIYRSWVGWAKFGHFRKFWSHLSDEMQGQKFKHWNEI